MAMETYIGGVTGDYEKKAPPVQTAKASEPAKNVSGTKGQAQPVEDLELDDGSNALEKNADKEPAKSTIDSTISSLNIKMAKTRCAYAYDEDTKRITIKVYDDETDELIREVPPEKSLEVLKKIWELAGIIIDERR